MRFKPIGQASPAGTIWTSAERQEVQNHQERGRNRGGQINSGKEHVNSFRWITVSKADCKSQVSSLNSPCFHKAASHQVVHAILPDSKLISLYLKKDFVISRVGVGVTDRTFYIPRGKALAINPFPFQTSMTCKGDRMDALLVAGADTMVGANFAAQLADRYRIVATSRQKPLLSNCDGIECRTGEKVVPAQLLKEIRPQRLVYCGPAAVCAWDSSRRPVAQDVPTAEAWFQAAKDAGVLVTLVSSDAVFTGPWMFHAENSQSVCPSPEAVCLRNIEQLAETLLPESLIVRTNAFGWGSRWLESLLTDLESGAACQLDCVRHASPILVNDLIDIVVKSWGAGLAGVYHIGGAERVNPMAFAQRLAAEFNFRIPRPQSTESLTDRSTGYGCSETSLQTRKIRRALSAAVPLVSEGLRRLKVLSLTGYRDQFATPVPPRTPARVA